MGPNVQAVYAQGDSHLFISGNDLFSFTSQFGQKINENPNLMNDLMNNIPGLTLYPHRMIGTNTKMPLFSAYQDHRLLSAEQFNTLLCNYFNGH